jgi:hypothetical protein
MSHRSSSVDIVFARNLESAGAVVASEKPAIAGETNQAPGVSSVRTVFLSQTAAASILHGMTSLH